VYYVGKLAIAGYVFKRLLKVNLFICNLFLFGYETILFVVAKV